MRTKVNCSKVVIKIIFRLFIASILLIPLGIFYIMNNGNPYTQYILNEKLPPYLEQREYSDEDILEQHTIEPKLIINKDYYQAHYMVIFKDEPDVEYFYGVKKSEKSINQFCEKNIIEEGYTTIKAKHSEEKCVSIYANRD